MKFLKKSIPYSVKNWLKLKKFKQLHSAVYIGPGVQIDPNTTRMGKHCGINDYSRVSHSTIGDYTYASRNNNIMNSTIGSYCSFGPGCQMGLGSHPAHFVSTSPIFYSSFGQLNNETWVDKEYYDHFEGVTIRDNVWLGANVIVLDGVTIGEGAIAAAGSIVTKDVPPYAIVGGVPAKVLKYRFDEETIERLVSLNLFSKGEEWLKKHLTGAVTPADLFNDVAVENKESEKLYG
ncbi:CatB-related O-acetyltransferase [Alkalihalobacillus sp. CinArs1]|uniref:CatB-related O-acetyltransferase n=1 Tax=Alkalihalobacillus sp. CinArs1 TaxID=2995314 RepID=UPI002FD84BB9